MICDDFTGSLPRKKHGYEMLFVLTDKRPTISRGGIPTKFICDNGTQFSRRLFQDLFKEQGFLQQFTAPYTPQINPTEIFNRTIKTMIAQFTGKSEYHWNDVLLE